MGIDELAAEGMALKQSQSVSEFQVKLQKGALKQEGEIVLKLIENLGPGCNALDSGRLLNVVA